MTQAYSNPERESDPHALPDVEVFYQDKPCTDDNGQELEPGWYWWSCFPGCLPDSDPSGPFETETLAITDAQSHND